MSPRDTSPGSAPTRALAEFVVNARHADVPDDVYREACRTLLNWTGCALGGSRHVAVETALLALRPFLGNGQASIIGRTEQLDVPRAALINGMSSHVLDFDDTHLDTLIHPAGPVVSAILAWSEFQKVSGADLLLALILGVEVECRIGRSVNPDHYARGWHITSTTGVFGAAAAVGKLIGLTEQQMQFSFGIAGTQASGLRAMFGSMGKSFHPGRAAENGLIAAVLAREGFTSSDAILEAPRGFGRETSADFVPEKITEGLGQHFEISTNSYKPFACGVVLHPIIDACLQLQAEHALVFDDISKIQLSVHPLVLELTGIRQPLTGLERKFSVYHSAAIAFVHRTAGEGQYSDEVVRHPDVVSLRNRVAVEPNPTQRSDEVRLTISLRNGKTLRKDSFGARGGAGRPLSDCELKEKFLGLARGVISVEKAEEVVALCADFENVQAAQELPRLCRSTSGL